MEKDRTREKREQGHDTVALPEAVKYLGQRYPSDDYRVRLDFGNGKRRYKRFPTELDAQAYIGRIVQQWEQEG